MDRYGELGYTRSHLEVQKLAYLLQAAGEPLRLRYDRGHYGPYAHALNKTLRELEGHFTVGLGDRERPMAQIELLDGAVDEARRALTGQPEAQERFERVARLIEGFESPYGLELLASIHWLAEEERKVSDPDEALDELRAWTRRKADLFQPHHVETAWQRLESQGWLSAA